MLTDVDAVPERQEIAAVVESPMSLIHAPVAQSVSVEHAWAGSSSMQ
jgi:hypothetical protein